jgi:hypothetical protein
LGARDALLWLLAMPDVYLRTAAVRCFDEFVDLWTLRFNQKYPPINHAGRAAPSRGSSASDIDRGHLRTRPAVGAAGCSLVDADRGAIAPALPVFGMFAPRREITNPTSATAPPFLQGIPATQFPVFGLCGR